MAINKTILLCAGGTGGHLFPAQSLARELMANGWDVHLATDDRAKRFLADFPASETHIIKSATIGGRNPFKMLKAALTLGGGYRQSRAMIDNINPAAAVGFGGYPTLPPMMAAASAKIPVLLHEQNAVMGRANRLLAKKASAIAMGFGTGAQDDKIIVLGNPVRAEVLSAAKTLYDQRKISGPFNLLVFGGSQGARFFSEIMPAALRLLKPAQLKLLNIVQQARPEDEAALKSKFSELGITSEVSHFFSPMATRIANAHMVIGRGGASTVSECAIIGRPSILVPLPGSLDNDQAANAAGLEKAGGCKVIAQVKLTAERLAQELQAAIEQPKDLAMMAQKAKKTGKPQAAIDMARLVEHIIGGGKPSQF